MQNRILHVEDNPDDVELTEMAFRRADVPVHIDPVSDGDSAIAALQAAISDSCLPRFMLLDMKLPGKSGLEVLSWVRAHPQLRRLPVIMLTSSVLPEDINQAYDRGANSYLLKPPDLDALTSLARSIGNYWLKLNMVPSLAHRSDTVACSRPAHAPG
jgi:CheY-like chemotaxis protein